MIRNSRALSGIQRIAGGEMAVAVLMFEWTCEVAVTNSALKSRRVWQPGFLRNQRIGYNVPDKQVHSFCCEVGWHRGKFKPLVSINL